MKTCSLLHRFVSCIHIGEQETHPLTQTNKKRHRQPNEKMTKQSWPITTYDTIIPSYLDATNFPTADLHYGRQERRILLTSSQKMTLFSLIVSRSNHTKNHGRGRTRKQPVKQLQLPTTAPARMLKQQSKPCKHVASSSTHGPTWHNPPSMKKCHKPTGKSVLQKKIMLSYQHYGTCAPRTCSCILLVYKYEYQACKSLLRVLLL